MNEAQTWTVIGAFITFMLGTLTMVWYSFSRVLRAEIRGLRGELRAELIGQISELRADMTGQINGLRGEIGELRADVTGQIVELRGEVRALTNRVDALDQDVQKLVERYYREG